MSKEYVDRHDDGYWIAGTRVSLESVVYSFLQGSSPESIVQSFPVLSLEEVYGAIAHYLANQPEIDKYLQIQESEFAESSRQSFQANRSLHKKLQDAKPSPTRT